MISTVLQHTLTMVLPVEHFREKIAFIKIIMAVLQMSRLYNGYFHLPRHEVMSLSPYRALD